MSKQIGTEVDMKQAQPAKTRRMEVIRKGELKVVYLARAKFPNLQRPVIIATHEGEVIEFNTAKDANEHARAMTKFWREN